MRETVLLSGGLDSATVLASGRAARADVGALFVDFGQPAHREEQVSASALANHFGVELETVRISGLQVGAGEISGRNLLLVSVALTAGGGRPGMISMGIHAGTAYWDCGADFVAAVQRLLDGYSRGRQQFHVPLLALGKADVIALARSSDVPLELTYSCEVGGGPCGSCLSCQDRTLLDDSAA